MSHLLPSLVESFDRLGAHLGIELMVCRDDLLPFPLAGNKVRKISAELAALVTTPDLLVTNGAIYSNHCRTLAVMAAQQGIPTHLVLHGNVNDASAKSALKLFHDLGAGFTVVAPGRIATALLEASETASSEGKASHVIPGGCHTAAGAIAYRDAANEALAKCQPDYVILASGTGATQGGIAASACGGPSRVVGVSVARQAQPGREAVLDAAFWAGAPPDINIDFRDSHVDGGYGHHGEATERAVRLGWAYGLPLDPTYTGKAFAGLLSMVRSGEIRKGEKVLFWHTGGLANYLVSVGDKN